MPNHAERLDSTITADWKQRLFSSLLFVFLLIAYSYWTWTPELNDLLGDSSFYILIAQYYSPFVPANPVVAFFATQNSFPPLYPLLLTLTGGATHLLVAHQLTAATLVLAFYALYRWLQLEGVGWRSALVATALIAIIPGVYTEALYLRSEPLFLLLSLCAFAVFARAQGVAPVVRIVLTALCVAAAVLTRSMGIAMLLAFIGVLLLRREPYWWLGVAVAVLPAALWRLFGASGELSYLDGLASRLQVTGADNAFSDMPVMAGILAEGWHTNLNGAGANSVPVWIIGIACIAATGYRALLCKLDAFYVILTLLLLMLWPYGSERVRFMMVLVPVMLAQLLIVASGLRIRGVELLQGRVVFPVVALISITTLAPNLLLAVRRSFEPVPANSSIRRTQPIWFSDTPLAQRVAVAEVQQRYMDAITSMAVALPAGECVITVRPSLVGLYANRLAGAMPAIKEDGSTVGGEYDSRCHYILMSPSIPTYMEPLYPFRIWHDRIELTQMYYLDPDNPDSAIIAMLGKFKSVAENP